MSVWNSQESVILQNVAKHFVQPKFLQSKLLLWSVTVSEADIITVKAYIRYFIS